MNTEVIEDYLRRIAEALESIASGGEMKPKVSSDFETSISCRTATMKELCHEVCRNFYHSIPETADENDRGVFYRWVCGDSLHDIANKHGLTMKQVESMNMLDYVDLCCCLQGCGKHRQNRLREIVYKWGKIAEMLMAKESK